MTNQQIYNLNLTNNPEFAALNALYAVFTCGDDDQWPVWWTYASQFQKGYAMPKQKQMLRWINKEYIIANIRPVITKTGIVIGNVLGFVVSFNQGLSFEVDFID